MSTKDLFKKGNKVLTKSQVEKIKKDLESEELVGSVVKANNRFLSNVDYSKPENFCFYGSAEKYYEDSFDRIYKTYPYDGSQKEKQQWLNDSSELDLWIYDNVYPKTTGYLKLGSGQSVFVKGGPNKDPDTTTGQKEELSKQYPTKQGKSNIWDPSIYRNSNLHLDASLGCTVEFWMKLDSPSDITYPFVIGNKNGERIKLRWIGAVNQLAFDFTDDSFTGAVFSQTARTTFAGLFESTWNHYSFTFINGVAENNRNQKMEVYKNGTLVQTVEAGVHGLLGTISQEELYLNINGTMTGVNGTRSNTVSGMHIDDFRFWKTRRTREEIARYWNTSVFGGTNTDDDKYNTENRKVDLGIYYKFNEGITGIPSIDEVVLDYSGRISNGIITKYGQNSRSINSAIDEYLDSSGEPLKSKEEKDPIIYSAHPDVASSLSEYKSLGLVHDLSNNSSIYHTMPDWITDEDSKSGENVKELSQVISSYFDNAQIQVQELTNLQQKKYNSLKTENDKPFFLIRKNLESQGFEVPDLFTEATAFEEILSRNETFRFEEKLQDIKNTIYQNIYNNLSYIYKSKGTEKAFRNLIRCFGIDDELVKINMYSDGADYSLEDTRRSAAIKKNFVDFNNPDRKNGLVYTKSDSSNAESTSYIRGVGHSRTPNLSFTFQTEVIFPKRVSKEHPQYSIPTNLEEHIALLGEYTTDYTNNKIFTLKAVKENSDPKSENVKFSLSFDGQTVETGFFKSVYENSKWNIAVRMIPKKELSTLVSGAATTDYEVQLYCVRTTSDIIEEEVTKTATIVEANARAILAKDKYVSIGALHGTGNPTGSGTSNNTFVKISSTLFWYDNVTNEEVRAHATDASNFGRLHPNEDAYSTDITFNTNTTSAIQVPRRDTLALHWDFSKVTTSDSNGLFVVDDLSEGHTKTLVNVNEKAILFDGNQDHVLIGDSDDFSFTDGTNDKPFTISAWVYVDDVSSDNGPFVTKALVSSGTGLEYIFKHFQGKLRVFLYKGTGTSHRITLETNSVVLTDQTWHHVVFTYSGNKLSSGMAFYVDGTQVTSTNTSFNSDPTTAEYTGMTASDTPLILGKTNNSPAQAGQAFEDKMADVCIFDKQLTATEVSEIYDGGQVKDMTKATTYNNLISWWKMGDDLDELGIDGIKDYKGGHHGDLMNNAAIVTEGSLPSGKTTIGKYGWFTELVGYQVTGEGRWFPANDKQVVNTEFVYSAKHRTPEVINSEELVKIRSQDDISFPKDADVTTHFFAAEKSMYQVISDDMINLFATITEFNDLIGQPVNRYRMEYKALEKFRQRYFEKVKNVPSFEKYIELYKWIDSSIGMMIQQLIPISSNFSADLRNMVESHVLERNKYWTKFPTMEMSGEPPLGIAKGINELTYNWKDGSRNVGETAATGSIKFTSSDPADYTTQNAVIRDATGQTVTIHTLNNSSGGFPTGHNISDTEWAAQINGMTSSEQIAEQFTLALAAAKTAGQIRISASYDSSGTVTLVQDDKGHEGNDKLLQVSFTSNSEVSAFAGGSGAGFLWLSQRQNPKDEVSGYHDESNIDKNREILRRVSTRTTQGLTHLVDRNADGEFEEEDKPTLYTDGDSVYEGGAYVNRALAKPYKIDVQKALTLRGGVNYSETTRDPNTFIRTSTRIVPGSATSGVQLDGLGKNPVTYEEWKKKYTVKRTSSVTIKDTEINIDFSFDGDVIYPYYGTDFRDVSATLVNIHSDSYGDDAEIPIQGPFTEAWVGGNQHRHVHFTHPENSGAAVFVRANGGNSHIVVPDYDDISFSNNSQDHSHAISFWVKPNFNTNQHQMLFGKRDENANLEYQAYLLQGDIIYSTFHAGNSNGMMHFRSSPMSPTDSPIDGASNEWYHVVINFDAAQPGNSSVVSFYINGALVGTDTEDQANYHQMQNTNSDLVIGNVYETQSYGLNGSLHDFVIFNFKNLSSGLSASDVAELYAANIENHPKKSDIVGWWKLHKDANATIGENGTATNVTFETIYERPELYLDDLGTLKHPQEIDVKYAAARYTREEVAKRPVNIRNIKTADNSPLGNYSKDYEIVQTSGRTKNNSWFVASGSGTPTTIQHPFVVGNEDTANIVGRRKRSADFTLPDRGTSDHVIVERFSAPGESLTMTRGYLDRIAEEFSPYAGINNRNLDARSDYATRLYTHSGVYQGSQGYENTTTGLPSVHKINRNASFRPLESGCTTDYDNAYVSHQMPRSDLQYAFITSSIDYDMYRGCLPSYCVELGSSIHLCNSGTCVNDSTNSIQVPHHEDFNITGDDGSDLSFSAAFWVKQNSSTQFQTYFAKAEIGGNSGGEDEYSFYSLNSGLVRLEFNDTREYPPPASQPNDGPPFSRTWTSGTVVNIGEWTHVAVVYDGSTQKTTFYSNGVPQEPDNPANIGAASYTDPETGVTSSQYTQKHAKAKDNPFLIGRGKVESNSNMLNGRMSNLIFYKNTVLTDAQVLEIKNASAADYRSLSTISSASAHFPLASDAKSTIGDHIGVVGSEVQFTKSNPPPIHAPKNPFPDGHCGPSFDSLGTSVHDSSDKDNGITVPHSEDFNMFDPSTGEDLPFAIAFWIKETGTGNYGATICAKRHPTQEASSVLEYQLLVSASGTLELTLNRDLSLTSTSAKRSRWTSNASLLPSNTTDWVHVVVTYDATPYTVSGATAAGKVKFYKNGVYHSQGGYTVILGAYDQMGPTLGQPPFLIGFNNRTPPGETATHLDGKISNLLVYKDIDLTAAQASEIYNSAVSNYSKISSARSLVAHFPLAGDAKSLIGDHEGTLSGVSFDFVDTPPVELVSYDHWQSTRTKPKPVRFRGYYDDIFIVKGNEGYNASYADYQGGGWRFTRNVEKPVVVNQRKTNTYSQLSRTDNSSRINQASSYIEPAVSWNKPNTHYILDENHDQKVRNAEAGSLIGVDLDRGSRPLSYSYTNNLELFANPDLTNAIDPEKMREGQFYDSLVDLFGSGDLLFTRSISRELIYPRHKNVGLKKTRSRGKYDTYKFFWKDKFQERIKTDHTTKLGYKLSQTFQKRFKQQYSIDVLDNFHYKQTGHYSEFNGSDIVIADADILSPSITGFSISMWLKTVLPGCLVSKQGEYEIYYVSGPSTGQLYRVKIYDAAGTGSMEVDFARLPGSGDFACLVVTYNGTGLDQSAIKVYEDGIELTTSSTDSITTLPANTSNDLHIGNLNGGASYFAGQMYDFAIYDEELSQSQINDIFSDKSLDKTISVSPVLRLPLGKDTLDVAGSNHGVASNLSTVQETNDYRTIGDLSYFGFDRSRHFVFRKDLLNTEIPSDGIDPPKSATYGLFAAAVFEEPNTPRFVDEWLVKPIPSPQLYHSPHNDDYDESYGWINRKSVVTDRKANYNDYESFSEDIKLAAQNYGLVSEFRISEHMDKYILESGGDFLQKNYDFLTLNGASYDGTTHTLSSNKTTTSETSSFYSTRKEDESQKVTSYPTNDSDTTLILNNATGFTDQNRIYSPSNSTFVISNSVNSTFEISESKKAHYIGNDPLQDGTNASAVFNIHNTNDFLVSNSDIVAVGGDSQGLMLHQSDPELVPFTVSIWAQPDANLTESNSGIWCAGDTTLPIGGSHTNLNLFSQYTYPAADSSYQTLGLTFAIAAGSTTSIPGGKPGGNVTDDSSVYTFFDYRGQKARLIKGQMNHVVFQMVPPNKSSAAIGGRDLNFAIKLWLNGEELYGVHIREFLSATYNNRNTNSQSIIGYSPCPIGEWRSNPVFGDYNLPWFTNYDTVLEEQVLGSATPVKAFVIGNCDFEDSYHNTTNYGGATPQYPFKGLLDEFCVIRGILPSESIKKLYNSGKPVNVNELILNNEIKGNLLVTNADDEDNGEWDFGYTPKGVAPIFEDNFESYTDGATLNDQVVANYSSFKYTTWVNTGTTTAVIKKRDYTNQDQGDDRNNQIAVLRGATNNIDPSPTDAPTPTGGGTMRWRWLNLQGVDSNGGFGGSTSTGYVNPIPALVTFKLRRGTGYTDVGGASTPSNDDYRMEDPDSHEDLWFQYSINDGANWTTLRRFDDFDANLRLDTLQEVPLPYFSPTSKVIFRWICATPHDTANPNQDLDHWGIDEIKIYDSMAAKYIKRRANNPFFKHTDFDKLNWTTAFQGNVEATVPIWHRIGVPKYDITTSSSTWDDDFFDSYVHTDNINFIEKSASKHDTLGLNTSERIRIKVNAIKKLIPYEGFYPQDRTVQIADLFVQKIKEDILFDENVHEEQAIQAALQHFFAPGILYNSLKSGVACDWATYTNESGLEPVYFGAPIEEFDNEGARTVKYSPRLFPQWYSSETYDPLTEILESNQPTKVSTEVMPNPSIPGLRQHQTAEAGLSSNKVTRNISAGFNIDYSVTNLMITKEPNKRLPFESLLDPYKYLVDGRDGTGVLVSGSYDGDSPRFKEIRTKQNQHFLMYPSYYDYFLEYNHTDEGTFTVDVDDHNSYYNASNFPYFEISSGVRNTDNRYEMAINNFVAEATKFFIRDEKLTSFAATKTQAEGYLMESGSIYFMDVAMQKSGGFKIVNSPGSLGGRYFGPQVMWLDQTVVNFGQDDEKVSDAAFAPYVPPYFYDSSITRISFSPTETKKHSLDEIFARASVYDVSDATRNYFNDAALNRNPLAITGGVNSGDGNWHKSPSYKARMPLTASLEFFGKTKLKRQEFDIEGNPVSISTPNNEELDTWVIYSKFECPLFDFSNPANSSSNHNLKRLGLNQGVVETADLSNVTYDFSYIDPMSPSKIGSGLWAGLGRPSFEGSGVKVSIRESFPVGTPANQPATATITISSASDLNVGDTITINTTDGTEIKATAHATTTTTTDTNAPSFLVSTSNTNVAYALERALDANSKISVTRNGNVITIVQATAGADGNTSIVLDLNTIDAITKTDFSGGLDRVTGSLMDVCGFTPETKQVGRLADQKQISEAVVMIPFFDEPLVTEQRLFGGGTRNVYATMNVDDRNFIKIPKRKYVRQKRNLDRSRPAYTLPDGREVDSSSITRMIEGMRKYNIPPLYDFETFDKDPFIMYFFEFNHTLDREDLSNIWQGVQPKIAKEASLDSVEISHDINEHELFGNFGEIPKGVRWMVFKVKKKAEKSYYNLTQDSKDDNRFRFKFDIGTKEPEYGYNYPYDYFTMLEMIQVEANSEKRVSPLDQLNRSLEDDE